MTLACARYRRQAFVAGMVLAFSAFLLIFLVVLARYAAADIARERRLLLEAHAEQILQSARSWSRSYVAQLDRSECVSLPVDQLVPLGTSSMVELRQLHADDGETVIECQLRLRRGRATVHRRVHWALSTPDSAP